MRLVKVQEKAVTNTERTTGESEASLNPGWDGKADPMAWRLPSGKALAEFALEAGFLVPGLLKTRAKDPGKNSGGLAPQSGKRL